MGSETNLAKSRRPSLHTFRHFAECDQLPLQNAKNSRVPELLSYQLSAISLSSYSVGRGNGVGRGLGVGVGLGAGAQYLPPVFRLLIPSGVPPQTIISLP